MTQVWTPDSVARIMAAVIKIENLPEQVIGGAGRPLPQVPYQFRRFRLAAELVEFSEASAYHMRYDNDGVLQEGETFTVIDLAGGYSGEAGDFGWAIHPHDKDRWEIVELAQVGGGGDGGNGGPYWGVLDGTLSKCSSQTVSVIDNCTTENETATDITAWDMLLATGDTLASGTKVCVTWFPTWAKWFVTAAECD